ncbi:AAA family ATPase, partial [Frankia sp. EI5c]|uniref:AAA family ATPase n=1 Tax=Frankia sp. EI5c TaxID=683316 RepID=UPI001F5BB8CE
MRPGRDPPPEFTPEAPAAPEAPEAPAAPEASPPPEEFNHSTVLAESQRTRVTRVWLATGPVIRKQTLGRGAKRRLQHELEILERLTGVDGVAQLVTATAAFPDSLLLADIGGSALSLWGTPLGPDRLVLIAETLARAVAGMHERGVVHRDISPANIVATPDGGRLHLIDFALATTLPMVRGEFTHHAAIVGTVPYLAPEQTGRTSRPVDQRADLYAVGATLYELATGTAPFGADDPLRIIHDHLARVPVPVSELNPAVPRGLAAVIAHLLEKEPDDRYQSAEGLAHDLALVRAGTPPARPGVRDRRARPFASSRLVGRDRELGELRAAFRAVADGGARSVLVSGEPGVGKTFLVEELRSITAGGDGWFVAGKFDQYRRDQTHNGLLQAHRALGRLLLAEPEERLAGLRELLRRRLGPSTGLAAAAVPELALLLGVPPAAGDLMTARARAAHAGVEFLRVVAAAKRPVVCFVDDIQWAARTPLAILDQIFGGDAELTGLLLIGAYRDSEVDPAAPLAEPLDRWLRRPDGPLHLPVENLPPPAQTALVADLLRIPQPPAHELARALAPAARGNPHDTVELLNTLRNEDLLCPDDGGWRWDAAALGRRLEQIGRGDLLAARVAALPTAAADLLACIACLASRVELGLLVAAADLPVDEVHRRLAPAITAGVLVPETESGGGRSVRFRHDRLREALLGGLSESVRDATRLRLARNLAAHPSHIAAAAEQYLPVLGAVHEAAERRTVCALLRQASREAKVVANHGQVLRFATAAATLVDPRDTETLLAVHLDRHAALYNLGRLEEADAAYEEVVRRCDDPVRCTPPTVLQLGSLTIRGRTAEATRLGLELVRRLGIHVPEPAELAAATDRRLDDLHRWLERTDEADDLGRPDLTDEVCLSAASLVDRILPAAYLSDQALLAWLTVSTLDVWARKGPAQALIAPASHIETVTVSHRGDYRTGQRVLRRLLAVGRARDYEPEIWQAEHLYAITCGHWFDPLEENLTAARRAAEELLNAGDLQSACWAHRCVLVNLLDCAPSLDLLAAEADTATELAARTGNQHVEESARTFRRLVSALCGEAAGDGAGADEAAELSLLADNPVAAVDFHITRALAAAVFDCQDELDRHLTAVRPLLPLVTENYVTLPARLLRVVALARRIRSGLPDQAAGAPEVDRLAALAELDETIDWLAARTADAPANFLHVLCLAQAERAWVANDFQRASYMFDAAHREAVARTRPWHLALILEEEARFYLAHGIQMAGQLLLIGTRRVYADWGATAKVGLVDWGNPGLRTLPAAEELMVRRPAQRSAGRSVVTTGVIDLRGIVAASRALSSETSVEGLRAKVVGVLSEMTGATDVHLLLRDEERAAWTVSTGAGHSISLREAGHRGILPPSIVWYAERTREPVVVADAATDDRFRRDPSLCRHDRCSLLAVPILIHGRLRAMLLLENRMIHHAFSTDRLEGIMLVASQLAVSLDNALMYTSLERKVTERT